MRYSSFITFINCQRWDYTAIIQRLSEEYDVPYTRNIQKKYNFGSLGRKLFPEAFAMNKEVNYEKQVAKDPVL